MNYTNSQILSAVLTHFMQPLTAHFSQAFLGKYQAFQFIENKIKSWGIVSSSWNLSGELAPVLEPAVNALIEPFLSRSLANVPDEAIPGLAHGIVDKAISDGHLILMEGKIELEKADLMELKKLLDYNLPLTRQEHYTVRTSAEPEETAKPSQKPDIKPDLPTPKEQEK